MLMCGGAALAQGGPAVTQPLQPEAGPGGRDYAYPSVRVTDYGPAVGGYWLFEPVGAGDQPMPVIVFTHGFNEPNYATYWLWIRHLVMRGNLVIYPRYHGGGLVNPQTFTPTAGDAVRQALARFDGVHHTRADPERFAMLGHSLGATINANLAARHTHFGLPPVKALMLLQPGDVRTSTGLGAFLPSIVEDHATIPAGTLMLLVSVVDDSIVEPHTAEDIYTRTCLIADADKDLLVMADDTHGRPWLRASHFTPLAYVDRRGNERVDAYDFAMWRWFDALTDAAFYDGQNRAIALGHTDEQLDIGVWSDGTAIRRPTLLTRDALLAPTP